MSLDASEMIALYDRHARELVGFFARRTGDPQLALDLLGDTFLAAFAARERCDAVADCRAARRLAVSDRRQQAHRPLPPWRERARALLRIGEELRTLTDVEYERVETLAAATPCTSA